MTPLAAAWPGILAARVQGSSSIWEQLGTFFSFEHVSVIYAVIGAGLLGTCCGLLGAFIVLRRMSLLGDSIGHAVLPGICVAFILMKTKDTAAIFAGAIAAGLIASLSITALTRYSRIKADTAIGLVLSTFFGLGIVLLTRIQRMSFGDQSGLDRYLFGDAAALSRDDLLTMAAVTIAAVAVITIFFRFLLATSFDDLFAASIGMPVRTVQVILMTLLALTIVTAIQAVGVVLVSAMLIIPPSTAYLLTDRLGRMLALSALFGVLSGLVGVVISFLLNRIPTGPCMVLAASAWFTLAYLLSPKQGVILRGVRLYQRRRRVRQENLLKTVWEARGEAGAAQPIGMASLAEIHDEPASHVQRTARMLARSGWARLSGDSLSLTDAGRERARQVVRNHRLWELYLAQQANIAADHVHRDAEDIEHVLGEDIAAKLEAMLEPEELVHGHPGYPRLAGPASPGGAA